MTVYSELLDVLKVKRKRKEDVQEHLGKMLKAADGLDEDLWNELSQDAQDWINDSVDAAKAKTDLPLPKGLKDDDAPAKANGRGKGKGKRAKLADDDDDDAEETKPTRKTAKGKSVKAKPAAKATKKAKGKTGNGIGGKRARLFTDDQRITVLVKKNPKQEGRDSYDRFEHYFNKKCKTVKDALGLGVRSGDLKWDVDHDYIKIS